MADDVQTYQDQLATLLRGQMAERPKPFLDPQMLALAEGFLTPGRTGSAWEAVGTAAGKLRTAQEQQQQQDQAEAARKIQMAQLGLQMAYQKRKEGLWDEYESANAPQAMAPAPMGQPPMPPMGALPDGRPEIDRAGTPAQVGPPIGGMAPQPSALTVGPVTPPPAPPARPPSGLGGAPQEQQGALPSAPPRNQFAVSGSPSALQTELGTQIAPPLNLPDERQLARLARMSGVDRATYENQRYERETKRRQNQPWGVFDSTSGMGYTTPSSKTAQVRLGPNPDDVYEANEGLVANYFSAYNRGDIPKMEQYRAQIMGVGRNNPQVDESGKPLPFAAIKPNPTVADVKAREAELALQQEMAKKEAEANFKARTETIPNMKQVSREQIETATQLKDLLKNNPIAFGPLAKSGFLTAATNFIAGKIVSKDPNELNGIDDLVVQMTGKDSDISARQNARSLINNVLFTLRQKNAGQGAWSNSESAALAATGPGLGDTPEALLNKLEILRLNGIKQQKYLEDYKEWQKNPINKGKGWLNYSESEDYEKITDEFDNKLKSIFKGAAPAAKPTSGQVIQWTPR
jgi:hypothetical protein